MPEWTANSEQALQTAIGDLRELWREKKWLKIKATTGTKRSLDQNGISHVWYEQIARELREDTVLGVKCECKLTIGVPILRAEDAEFREIYDSVIKPLSYENKLLAMKVWPVTSRMTKDQLSQYLSTMQETYDGRVALQFPKDETK